MIASSSSNCSNNKLGNATISCIGQQIFLFLQKGLIIPNNKCQTEGANEPTGNNLQLQQFFAYIFNIIKYLIFAEKLRERLIIGGSNYNCENSH